MDGLFHGNFQAKMDDLGVSMATPILGHHQI